MPRPHRGGRLVALTSTYTDHALSGGGRRRPGYQKLLEDARAGRFDVVVAEALDRLSRDQEDTAALYKQLGFAGFRSGHRRAIVMQFIVGGDCTAGGVFRP